MFRSFIKGCESHMVILMIQELGFYIELFDEIFNDYDVELRYEEMPYASKRAIVTICGYFVILYDASLRGGDVL